MLNEMITVEKAYKKFNCFFCNSGEKGIHHIGKEINKGSFRLAVKLGTASRSICLDCAMDEIDHLSSLIDDIKILRSANHAYEKQDNSL
jgi:transcription elongation factor Elf1